MKQHTLLLFSFFILFNTSCTSQQKTDHNKNNLKESSQQLKIELIEQTRGTNRLITFTPNSKIISLNGNVINSSLSSEEWKNITEQASLIDLSKISSFKSPSTGRFSDQALSSQLSIIKNGETYQSSSFDAGNPPKELENLYKVLMGSTKVEKKLPRE